MNKPVPLSSQLPRNSEIFPEPTSEEVTEAVARELVAALGALRRSELIGEPCSASTVQWAKRALAAATAAELALEDLCAPATREYLAGNVAAMVGSIPHSSQTVAAEVYGAMMVADVGATRPSKGAVETACRKLRTKSERLPKIPEVLATVREAEQLYEAARRAIKELPDKIATARDSTTR